jgi:hypothetical protein
MIPAAASTSRGSRNVRVKEYFGHCFRTCPARRGANTVAAMNESAPAPARPPVPWWERVAAGVLAVGFAFWQFVRPFQFVDFRMVIMWGLLQVQLAANAMVAQPSLDLNRLINLPDILDGIHGGLWLAMKCAVLSVIVCGLAIVAGRRGRPWRFILWWATFAHGAALCLSHAVSARTEAVERPHVKLTPLSRK